MNSGGIRQRRLVAAFVVAALTMVGVVHPSLAGAVGPVSTAVDDDVTAVVNTVGGSVFVLSNDIRVRSGPFNALAVVYPSSGSDDGRWFGLVYLRLVRLHRSGRVSRRRLLHLPPHLSGPRRREHRSDIAGHRSRHGGGQRAAHGGRR